MLGEVEQTPGQTVTMELQVGEAEDISLAVGEVVGEVAVVARMAEKEEKLEK